MKKFDRTALVAVATVLAHPFRKLLGADKPALRLTAPTVIAPAMPRALIGTTIRADATGDPKAMIQALQQAHNEFKETIEANIGAKADSAEVTAKLEKINGTMNTLEAALNEHALKLASVTVNGERGTPSDPEYTNTFTSFMRDGTRDAEDKLKSEQKKGPRAAMSEGVDADGGLLAPIEWDRTITGRLKLISPIRQEATVIRISKRGFTKLFTDRAVGSGWVGETASRPATSTPQFTALPFAMGEIYANAAASQDLLDDAEIALDDWLVGEIDTEFTRQEGIAHISGDGTNKPHGLLGYVTGGAHDDRHPWGAIEVVNSGAAAAFTADGMIDTIYKLPAAYTPNAKWFLNRTSLGAIRKLKDGQGNYLWQPTFVAGQPSTLAGYAVIDVPDLPNATAGNLAALFGDMRETYLVIDRIGVRVLRDPYTNKPYICFYVTKRTGGGVKNPDSMKAIKIGTGA